ncbi:MAG: hypothetical protein ACOC55_05630 [Candidatus Natronoplasma sp.]
MYDVVEPCSDSGAYRAEPTVETKLDPRSFEEELIERGYEIEFSSEVLLLVKDEKSEVEVGIYPSGKLLFKTTDKDMVDELFEEFTPLVEEYVKSTG